MREEMREEIKDLLGHYLETFLLSGYLFRIFFKGEEGWDNPCEGGEEGAYSFAVERKFPYLEFHLHVSEKTEKVWSYKSRDEKGIYMAHEVVHILLSGIHHRATHYQNEELILDEEEQVCDILAKLITSYENTTI